MEKSEIENRVNTLRDNAEKNNSDMKNPNDKECPFRDQVCNSRCKLFRASRKGFECPFQEISSMSWDLKTFVKKMLG